MKSQLKLAAFALCMVAVAPAFATTATVTNSAPSGTKITFTATDPAPASETFGIATFSGGAFLTPDSGNYGGTSAAPPGSGIYYSIGIYGASGNVDSGSVSFSKGLSQLGFEWGSPDAYNSITFYDKGGKDLGSYTGQYVQSIAPPPPFNLGNQQVTEYFSFTSADPIYSASYVSTGNAFETANYSYVAAVPEASDFALFLGGLGFIAFVASRKRKAKSNMQFAAFA